MGGAFIRSSTAAWERRHSLCSSDCWDYRLLGGRLLSALALSVLGELGLEADFPKLELRRTARHISVYATRALRFPPMSATTLSNAGVLSCKRVGFSLGKRAQTCKCGRGESVRKTNLL